jgi:hypothetical protein
MSYDVFISYSRGDGAFVERLDALLTGAGISTWFDRRSLRPGQKWEDVIEDEVSAARVFLACLSATAQDERGYFHVEQQLASKAAMRVPSDQLFIIPVLLGECSLPRELRQYHSVNLLDPGAIESLLSSLIEALGRNIAVAPHAVAELRNALRMHLGVMTGPFGADEFTDKDVNNVVRRLRSLHENQGREFLAQRELLPELDSLFDCKTFRFEALRRCPEQRWADRLDSAYQTLKVLQSYMRNIRDTLPAKYPIYRDLVMAVDKYCMQMGALLFESGVDYNEIEDHIGKSTFKAHLPKEIRFPVGPDKQPEIPDAINNMIEPHRLRAVEMIDQLVAE